MIWYEKLTAGILVLGFILFVYASWHSEDTPHEAIPQLTIKDTKPVKECFPEDCTGVHLYLGEDFEAPEGTIRVELLSDCTLKFHYAEDKDGD